MPLKPTRVVQSRAPLPVQSGSSKFWIACSASTRATIHLRRHRMDEDSRRNISRLPTDIIVAFPVKRSGLRRQHFRSLAGLGFYTIRFQFQVVRRRTLQRGRWKIMHVLGGVKRSVVWRLLQEKQSLHSDPAQL